MAAEKHTFDSIMRDLKARKFRPVYIIMGEEAYYIDKLSDYLENNVLTPVERDFNQTVVYGTDTSVAQVVDMAKRFPMMAERQVVMVKEAQNMRSWDKFENYLKNPQPTTVLVICYKNGTIDARKAFMRLAAEVGVVFNSQKKRDRELPTFIEGYAKENGGAIALNSNVANYLDLAECNFVNNTADACNYTIYNGGHLFLDSNSILDADGNDSAISQAEFEAVKSRCTEMFQNADLFDFSYWNQL